MFLVRRLHKSFIILNPYIMNMVRGPRIWTLIIFFVLCIHCLQSLIVNDKNTTKESSLETPPAIAMSRLPPSPHLIESNLTEVYPDELNKKKKFSNVKEVHEPTEEDDPTTSKNRSTNQRYESSATMSAENYVVVGENSKRYTTNLSKNIETGFRPFVPSPLFDPEKPILKSSIKEENNDDYSANYAKFKSSLPVKQEQFFNPDFNSYTSYGEVQSVDIYEPHHSKFYENEKTRPHLTTYTPPKINPMQRPFSTYKGKRKYPFLNPHHESWKNNEHVQEYPGKYRPDFGFPLEYADHEHLLDDNYNIYDKQHYADKPFKKTGLLQILTTLIPIGLLLSALPPRVIFINSTNSTPPQNIHKPFFRNLEEELSQINNYNGTSYNLVANIGLTPSDDPTCNKRMICEAALNGTSPDSSFVDSSLWHLLSRSSDIIRTNLNLQDVFETVLEKQCSKFPCSEMDKRSDSSYTITQSILSSYNVG